MAIKINLDHQAIQKAARQAVGETVRRAQPEFDRLHRSHAGRPVSEIEPRVRSIFRKYGLTPDDSRTIREYSSRISEGTQIVLKS